MGRDTLFSDDISIHAPARGATFIPRRPLFRDHISIHAPARGATSFTFSVISPETFQSTLPRGERPSRSLRRNRIVISIHAPARGATLPLPSRKKHIPFQSTLPRGERRLSRSSFRLLCHFNPRSREGSDSKYKQIIFANLAKLTVLHPNR